MASGAKPTELTLSAQKVRLFRRLLLGVLGAFIVGAGLAAETFVRYHERARTTPPDYFPSIYYPHRRLRYGLVPSLDYYGWFRINRHGFRGRDVSVEKPAGVFRIVCLGGSTTFDVGSIGPARPWPEVMEAELRRRLNTDAIEVLNLGIGGSNSLDSFVDLQTRALRFAPDLVIVFQGHNDLIYSIPGPSSGGGGLFPDEDRPRSSVTRWLTYHSLLYAKTEDRVLGLLSPITSLLTPRSATGASDSREDSMERGLTEFRSNIRSLAAVARLRHVPLVLPKVVVPFDASETEAGPCRICARLPETYGGLEVSRLREYFQRYDDALSVAATEGDGVMHLDTDGFVPSADRYYHDPVHFGPEGSQRMGEKMAEALVPLVTRLRR